MVVMESKNTYRKSVKLKEFQACSDRIRPLLRQRKFDDVFNVFDEMRIGPNTLNPKRRNFIWWIIELLRIDSTFNDCSEKENLLLFMKSFLSRGVDINHQDKYKITALSWAVYNFQADASLLLLENGAYPDAPDYSGRTPLDYAIENFYSHGEKSSEVVMSNIMTYLLQYGADPDRSYPSVNEVSGWAGWLFKNGVSGETYKTPRERLVYQAPFFENLNNVAEEPRLKIVLTTKPTMVKVNIEQHISQSKR